MLTFWQQILLSQASAALHAVFIAFGSKYFTQEEQSAVNVVIDALIDLPRRVHEGTIKTVIDLSIPTVPMPAKRGRKAKVK